MSIKPLIVLFNGPPGAGKDTAANVVKQWSDFARARNRSLVHIQEKFADPIKQICRTIYGTKEFNEHDVFDKKSLPSDVFFGKSCREVQIATSEKFLKIQHGERIFGELLAKRIGDVCELKVHQGYDSFMRITDNDTVLFTVSDSGFEPEAKVLIERFGAQNVMLIRLHRDGHSFPGDSRNYVELPECVSHDVKNEDIETFEIKILSLVAKFIKERTAQ